MKSETNTEISAYDKAIADLFFLLANMRYKYDLPLIKHDISNIGNNHIPDNEDLNFKGTIIAPYSLITNGYSYSATRLNNPVQVSNNPNLEAILLTSEQKGLQYPGLLNNDGALALTEDGRLAAAHVLYDGLIWNMIDDMQRKGIIKDKQPFDYVTKVLAYNGDSRGSTRRANAIAAAYVSGKKTICMDQTPYFPENTYKSIGLPRITVYNGEKGQSAILYFSNDPEIRASRANPLGRDVYAVLRLFIRPDQNSKIKPYKTEAGTLRKLKKAYLEYLKHLKQAEEAKADYLYAA